MTRDQETLLLIKGTIAELPLETQATIRSCYDTIKAMIAANPDGEALMAITLIGAEVAVVS